MYYHSVLTPLGPVATWANVPLAMLINLTRLLVLSTTCKVHYADSEPETLSQGIYTDEHVLAHAVVLVTDDSSACGGVSAIQVKHLICKLNVPKPVSAGKGDGHWEMIDEVRPDASVDVAIVDEEMTVNEGDYSLVCYSTKDMHIYEGSGVSR
jgi:hypothetical protein